MYNQQMARFIIKLSRHNWIYNIVWELNYSATLMGLVLFYGQGDFINLQWAYQVI
jgi:hypothetical protein